jgi:hypothetical protein
MPKTFYCDNSRFVKPIEVTQEDPADGDEDQARVPVYLDTLNFMDVDRSLVDSCGWTSFSTFAYTASDYGKREPEPTGRVERIDTIQICSKYLTLVGMFGRHQLTAQYVQNVAAGKVCLLRPLIALKKMAYIDCPSHVLGHTVLHEVSISLNTLSIGLTSVAGTCFMGSNSAYR